MTDRIRSFAPGWRTLLPVALLSAGLLTACRDRHAAAQTAPDAFGSASDPLFFELVRTPCFGTCPSYSFTVRADGTARYEGRSFAPRTGGFTGQVDRSEMRALYERAKAAGFFGFRDKYDGPVTDLPSTIIRVNADGKDKKVIGRVDYPAAFRNLAAYADSLVERVVWTPAPEK